MKTAPVFLSFLGLWAAVSHAQPALAPPTAPANDAAWQRALQVQREANFGSTQVAPDSGYYWLLKAAESLLPNPKPRPSLPADFAAYHAGSLRLLRIALQKDVVRPLVNGRLFETQLGVNGLDPYDAKFRRLADILGRESRGRLAAGDAHAALDSRLDCLQLGVIVSNGTFMDLMEGAISEEIGREDIEAVIMPLDAQSCRAAVAKLAVIESRRPTFAATTEVDATYLGQAIQDALFDAANRQQMATVEGRWFFGYHQIKVSEAQARQILALTPAQTRQISTDFSALAVRSAAEPFQKAKTAALIPDGQFSLLDNILLGHTEAQNFWRNRTRFRYEDNALQTHFLKCALELRAIKLETGAYPETFDAGIDPFSFPLAPLIYLRDGDTYRLYSVGPDGQDDGGAKIETTSVDKQTGEKTTSDRLSIESTGDISAPVF